LAVKSADDVLSVIKAFQMGSRAKLAADVAAINAQNACNNAHSDTAEKRAVQMRAVFCKSDAILATFINHEGYAAKRRSIISLAHDVFYWNAHRKQEFLRATTAHTLSQRPASAATICSWESLIRSSVRTTKNEAPPANAQPSGKEGPPDPEGCCGEETGAGEAEHMTEASPSSSVTSSKGCTWVRMKANTMGMGPARVLLISLFRTELTRMRPIRFRDE